MAVMLHLPSMLILCYRCCIKALPKPHAGGPKGIRASNMESACEQASQHAVLAVSLESATHVHLPVWTKLQSMLRCRTCQLYLHVLRQSLPSLLGICKLSGGVCVATRSGRQTIGKFFQGNAWQSPHAWRMVESEIPSKSTSTLMTTPPDLSQ